MDLGPDDTVDHGAAVPVYRQLVQILTARIERGDWQPGRAIPSEPRLVAEYGVGRDTVRRAVAVLVEEGLVFTVPHRGTYVTEDR